MCGIIGFVGKGNAATILYNGLRKMEYRGYDSAGIATIQDSKIIIKKNIGKVSDINKELGLFNMKGRIGIAHTRWATHGEVTSNNAHPHTSCNNEIAVIHNGIIENHRELKKELQNEGHKFRSQTDSEVISHLLEKYYLEYSSIKEAVFKTVNRLKGAFAFLSIFTSNPTMIFGARKDAPLVIGIGENNNFIASDILAFIENTDKVFFLDNREVAFVDEKESKIFGFNGRPIRKEVTQVAWEAKDASKEEFAHYTAKEIHEQPRTIKAALHQDPEKLKDFLNEIEKSKHIIITACGTSFHVGLILRNLLMRFAKIRANITLSSEFSTEAELIDRESLIIAISQSGETADLLSAVSKTKKRGGEVISILNVPNSSLDRESRISLNVNCGPEIGVAATKSFLGQLIISYLIAFLIVKDAKRLVHLNNISKSIENVMKVEDKIKDIAEKFSNCNDFYFVGRSLHFSIAMEGALKLKELSYNHAEGMAGGELKHGTLALIEKGTPVIVLNPEDETYQEMLGNVAEMKSRGAKIIGISNRFNEVYDEFIQIPTVDDILYPLIEVVPLQMLAYHMAILRNKDPDYPRNLAKSVTVK